ncbi:MAG TPA: enoyl-CoA hydratase/isomerase family protein [Longimicrobiales bacterium]|nr:enoyl-CoA hydratase/isomerase family protein [Longimicrobiales bacterium]
MTIETSYEDGIARLVMKSPPLNILTRAVMKELRQALASLANEDTLRVLVLMAEGKHFSAGAAVEEHLPPEHEEMIPEFAETIRALYHFPTPMVAAVRGRCLGGGFELVQTADIVVAGESAQFGVPEIQLGVLPPAACGLLPELTTPQVAAELIYTGDALSAADALAVGLVRRVVPDEAVDDGALALAGRMARHSAASLRRAKRALRAAYSARVEHAVHRAVEIYLHDLMKTADAVEGLRAFTEKRRPEWSHR